jgi:hypothetical protein
VRNPQTVSIAVRFAGWLPALPTSLLALLLVGSAGGAGFPVPQGEFAPRGYLCGRCPTPPLIDGRLDDAPWQAAPWTEPFVDIEGDLKPAPYHETRAKLLWDDEALYIGAWLEEPHLWATYAGRDMVIYHENDFEWFIDPDGDNHDYFELEINALGTVWDLYLTRPYRDEGDALDAWDIPGLRSAVHLEGTLNDPGDVDRGWSVEMAIPWKAFSQGGHRTVPPLPGDSWRLNFSRVQWTLDIVDGAYAKRKSAEGRALPEYNWVWSPQGLIAMHYPERWGLLHFVEEARGARMPALDPSLAAGEALMQLYYAQRRREALGLPPAADPGLLELPAGAAPGWSWPPLLLVCGERWTASLEPLGAGPRLIVDERGRLSRHPHDGGTR